jgi:hypothetical protein
MSIVPSIIVLMITALLVFRHEIITWSATGLKPAPRRRAAALASRHAVGSPASSTASPQHLLSLSAAPLSTSQRAADAE